MEYLGLNFVTLNKLGSQFFITKKNVAVADLYQQTTKWNSPRERIASINKLTNLRQKDKIIVTCK